MPGFDMTTMYPNDLFQADIVGNHNFKELADNLYPMWKGTQAAYDAITTKQQKLYIVEGEKDVTLFFGDKPISSGLAPASAILTTHSLLGSIVEAESNDAPVVSA